MTPLQKVAAGELLILVDASVNGFDLVPDTLGWVLILVGVVELRERIPVSALVPLAVVSGLVSLAGLVPGLMVGLPPSIGWAASLPQIAFDVVLCSLVAAIVTQPLAGRFRVLRWILVGVAIGPVLVYGGELRALLVPLAVVAIAAGVYLIYLLFRASTEVHGPRLDLRRRPPEPETEG